MEIKYCDYEIFSADKIRELQREKNDLYNSTVIERAIAKIYEQVDKVARGEENYRFISVYGLITEEVVKFFEDRGFTVVVFYKKDGMRVGWEKK